METRIPFRGFYQGVWNDGLDSAFESLVDSLCEDYPELERREIEAIVPDKAKYELAFDKIAEKYVGAFQDWLEVNCGLKITLRYAALNSPKEYNFTTDRIFADIDLVDARVAFKKAGREEVAKAAKALFTSRSGFISFYDPDIEAWGPLETWDHNQLMSIFVALVGDADVDFEIYQSDEGQFVDDAFAACVDWDAVDREILHRIDIHKGDAVEDGRKFPEGDMSLPEYVKKFEELNNLKGEA